MKKIIAILLICMMFFTLSCTNTVSSDVKIPPKPVQQEETIELSPHQQRVIQLNADILCECVLETAAPYIVFGFATETALWQGMKECTVEGTNLEDEMTKAGISYKDRLSNLQSLFDQMVIFANNERDKRALMLLKEYEKEKNGEKDF